jgi:hypothetical protein
MIETTSNKPTTKARKCTVPVVGRKFDASAARGAYSEVHLNRVAVS